MGKVPIWQEQVQEPTGILSDKFNAKWGFTELACHLFGWHQHNILSTAKISQRVCAITILFVGVSSKIGEKWFCTV